MQQLPHFEVLEDSPQVIVLQSVLGVSAGDAFQMRCCGVWVLSLFEVRLGRDGQQMIMAINF